MYGMMWVFCMGDCNGLVVVGIVFVLVCVVGYVVLVVFVVFMWFIVLFV